jgi:hypothetical protein
MPSFVFLLSIEKGEGERRGREGKKKQGATREGKREKRKGGKAPKNVSKE